MRDTLAKAVDRRRVLEAGGALAAAFAGGCLDAIGGGDPEPEDNEEPDGDPGLRVDDRYLSSAFPIELVDPRIEAHAGHVQGEDLVANVHWHGEGDTHWHFAPLTVPDGGSRTVRTRFVEAERLEAIPLDGEPFDQRVRLAGGSAPDRLERSVDADLVELRGTTAGEAELVFELRRDGDPAWTSPRLPVVVE